MVDQKTIPSSEAPEPAPMNGTDPSWNIADMDIIECIKHRFRVEQIARYAKFERPWNIEYTGARSGIRVAASNSILFEFDTPIRDQGTLHTKYNLEKYRLLFLAAPLRRSDSFDFGDPFRKDIFDLRRKHAIDDVSLWVRDKIPSDTIHSLNDIHIHVMRVDENDCATVRNITHFTKLDGKTADYAILVNAAVEVLSRRLKRMFHLALSEIAAPIYDEIYSKPNLASTTFRKHERDIIDKQMIELSKRQMTGRAIDVGCGTGEYAFRLAKRFDRVDAFDLSHRMIDAAIKKKEADLQLGAKIYFHQADIEDENLPDEDTFITNGEGEIDLIIASFGMGSFVEDTVAMLRRFHGWLKDGGRAVLSFYNANSLVVRSAPMWRDPSLAAHLDVEAGALKVQLTPRTSFHVFCRAYNDEVRAQIARIFEVVSVSTYPTIMSIMPNSYLSSEGVGEVFQTAEAQLSKSNLARGHYVTVIAEKKRVDLPGYKRVLAALKRNGLSVEADFVFADHKPVRGVNDVAEIMGCDKAKIVKTVLFSIVTPEAMKETPFGRLVAAVVQGHKRVDSRKLAGLLDVAPRRLIVAPDKIVTQLGFPHGGLAAFGFPQGKKLRVRHVLDRDLLRYDEEWLYMGTGNVSRTLKIRVRDFLKVVAVYESGAIAHD